MKKPAFFVRWLLPLGIVLGLAGCGGSSESEEAGHDHAGHAHTAKYGGELVELGHHEGNLEVVVDPKAGKLTVYVLDAHAENFVRLPLDSIPLDVTVGGAGKALVLKPVGNTATGEKPGDTSQFEATADWLKTATAFKGTIRELPVKSKSFQNVEFSWPH